MTTENQIWVGGATAVNQVATGTIGGSWSTSDTIRTTLTAEDGSTQAVTSTSTGSTIETDVRDIHLADLQGSTNSLFAAITWTDSGTTAIVGTAKVGGTPFYIAGTVPVGSGTFSYAATTANAGPYDFNTLANWVTEAGVAAAAVPDATDLLFFVNSDYPVKFGLVQSGYNLGDVIVGPGQKGTIGDPDQKFYLQLDLTGSELKYYGGPSSTWLKGTMPTITITGGRPTADMLHLSGTLTDIRINDPGVQGTITVADSTAIGGTIYMLGAGGARMIIGENVTGTPAVIMNAGRFTTESAMGTYTATGGIIEHKKGNATLNNYGAEFHWRSPDAIVLVNYGGDTFIGDTLQSATTVTSCTIESGRVSEVEGIGQITYSASPGVNQNGGEFIPSSRRTFTPANA